MRLGGKRRGDLVVEQRAAGLIEQRQLALELRDGKPFNALMLEHRIALDSRVSHIIAIMRDVTARFEKIKALRRQLAARDAGGSAKT